MSGTSRKIENLAFGVDLFFASAREHLQVLDPGGSYFIPRGSARQSELPYGEIRGTR